MPHCGCEASSRCLRDSCGQRDECCAAPAGGVVTGFCKSETRGSKWSRKTLRACPMRNLAQGDDPPSTGSGPRVARARRGIATSAVLCTLLASPCTQIFADPPNANPADPNRGRHDSRSLPVVRAVRGRRADLRVDLDAVSRPLRGPRCVRPDCRPRDFPGRHVGGRDGGEPVGSSGAQPLAGLCAGGIRRGLYRARVPRRLRADDHLRLRFSLPRPGGLGLAPAGQVGPRKRPDSAAIDSARRHLSADERRSSPAQPRAAGPQPCPPVLLEQSRGRRRRPGCGVLPGRPRGPAGHAGDRRNIEPRRRRADDRRGRPPPAPRRSSLRSDAAPDRRPADRRDRRSCRLLLGVAFGTAVASFIYEIAWIRMLSLVLGSATHSFELMLSAFILGIALGALWIHGRADALRIRRARWASSSGSWAAWRWPPCRSTRPRSDGWPRYSPRSPDRIRATPGLPRPAMRSAS